MSSGILRRYTNLAALIHILRTREIALLSPDTWDDRNDSYFLNVYKERKKAASVLALCFSEAPETYHHWRVFSHGTGGVCIEFEKENLVSLFRRHPNVQAKPVTYKLIDELQKNGPRLQDLPFLKRHPYRDEEEFRVVLTEMSRHLTTSCFGIDLGWIRRIALSPWMPVSLSASVKGTLRTIPGCDRLRIDRSTLVENDRWKSFADNCSSPRRTGPKAPK